MRIHKSGFRKGQFNASILSVKCAILHEIVLANWMSSSHGSGVSPQLENLLF